MSSSSESLDQKESPLHDPNEDVKKEAPQDDSLEASAVDQPKKEAPQDDSLEASAVDQPKEPVEETQKESLKQIGEVLKAVNDKVDASNQETTASLERIEGILKSNDERMKQLEASVGEIAHSSKVVSAKPKSITHQGMILLPFNERGLFRIPCLKSQEVNLMGATWYITLRYNNCLTGSYIGAHMHCIPLEGGDMYDTNFALQLLSSGEEWMKRDRYLFKKEDEGNSIAWPEFISVTTLLEKGFLDEQGNGRVQANFTFTILSKDHKDEIAIGDDVEAVVSTQLLEAMYPSLSNEISASNVECLLRMADRFKLEIVTQDCERFLKGCSTAMIPLEKKLVLAQVFGLKGLLTSCVAKYKTWEDIKKLKQTEEYALLTSETKGLMFDSI